MAEADLLPFLGRKDVSFDDAGEILAEVIDDRPIGENVLADRLKGFVIDDGRTIIGEENRVEAVARQGSGMEFGFLHLEGSIEILAIVEIDHAIRRLGGDKIRFIASQSVDAAIGIFDANFRKKGLLIGGNAVDAVEDIASDRPSTGDVEEQFVLFLPRRGDIINLIHQLMLVGSEAGGEITIPDFFAV